MLDFAVKNARQILKKLPIKKRILLLKNMVLNILVKQMSTNANSKIPACRDTE
jgi:hypothetical protein